jgi:hypothetical protein
MDVGGISGVVVVVELLLLLSVVVVGLTGVTSLVDRSGHQPTGGCAGQTPAEPVVGACV